MPSPSNAGTSAPLDPSSASTRMPLPKLPQAYTREPAPSATALTPRLLNAPPGPSTTPAVPKPMSRSKFGNRRHTANARWDVP